MKRPGKKIGQVGWEGKEIRGREGDHKITSPTAEFIAEAQTRFMRALRRKRAI